MSAAAWADLNTSFAGVYIKCDSKLVRVLSFIMESLTNLIGRLRPQSAKRQKLTRPRQYRKKERRRPMAQVCVSRVTNWEDEAHRIPGRLIPVIDKGVTRNVSRETRTPAKAKSKLLRSRQMLHIDG
jgi:hypothetical protein